MMNKCTFAIVNEPFDVSHFVGEKLFFSNYCVRMKKTHPLAEKDLITVEDVSRYPIVGKGRSYHCFRTRINKHILFKGLPLKILLETADEKIIQQIILDGETLNLTYDYSAFAMSHDEIIVKNFAWTEEECGQNIFLLENKNNQLTKADKIFKNFFLDWIKIITTVEIILKIKQILNATLKFEYSEKFLCC